MSVEENEVSEAVSETPKTKKPKVEYDSVVMTDGSTKQFPRKKERNGRLVGTDMLKDYNVSEDNQSVTAIFYFRNGEVRYFTPQPTGDAGVLVFAGHGAIQKIGDELADPQLEDIEDKVAAVDRLIEQLNEGKWTSREPGDSMAGTSILLKALMEKNALSASAKGVAAMTVEAMKAWLKGKKHEEKMALRTSAALKPIIDRLEAEKVAKLAKVDTESLLAELG